MDFYDVDEINDNMDVIDKKLKELDDLSTKTDKRFLTETTNVYVSNDGNDVTGDGSQEKPWKTIQYAVNMCPSVVNGTYGFYVHLAPGVYDEVVDFRDKTLYFTILGGETLEEADNYIITALKSYRVSSLNVKGVKFTGADYKGYSNWAVNFGSGYINLQYCKFDDCILDIETNGGCLLSECNFSNYRTGTGSYGTIRVTGGSVHCNAVSGSNNKSGYGASAGSKYGGNIYVNSECTLTADTLFIESNCGKVYYGTSGWQLIGTVT